MITHTILFKLICIIAVMLCITAIILSKRFTDQYGNWKARWIKVLHHICTYIGVAGVWFIIVMVILSTLGI